MKHKNMSEVKQKCPSTNSHVQREDPLSGFDNNTVFHYSSNICSKSSEPLSAHIYTLIHINPALKS